MSSAATDGRRPPRRRRSPAADVLAVAGAVAFGETPPRRRLTALLVLNAVTALPIALPILPAPLQARLPLGEINTTLVETIGWPELVENVADVVTALPADERDNVVLLAGSYGEAGALDRFGPAHGLPPAYSGHNSYWHWRRPRDDTSTHPRLPRTAWDLARRVAGAPSLQLSGPPRG